MVAMSTSVFSSTAATSSRVSETGISSGVVTMTSPVWSGSPRIWLIQSVCDLMRPTLTRSLMTCGAESWLTMWPVAGASTTTVS